MNPGGLSIAKKSRKSKLNLHKSIFIKAVDSNLTAIPLLKLLYSGSIFLPRRTQRILVEAQRKYYRGKVKKIVLKKSTVVLHFQKLNSDYFKA